VLVAGRGGAELGTSGAPAPAASTLPLLCSRPSAALPARPSCSHADLTDEQVEAARNATRDLAAGGSAAALPATPVATFAPAPLPEATARRLLRVSEQEVLGNLGVLGCEQGVERVVHRPPTTLMAFVPSPLPHTSLLSLPDALPIPSPASRPR